MAIEYVNLTPHPITLIEDAGSVTIEPCGTFERIHMVTQPSVADTLPAGTVVQRPQDVAALHERLSLRLNQQGWELQDPSGVDIVLIVAGMVLDTIDPASTLARYVVAPDTGVESAVRDDAGQIVGVRRFRSRY